MLEYIHRCHVGQLLQRKIEHGKVQRLISKLFFPQHEMLTLKWDGFPIQQVRIADNWMIITTNQNTNVRGKAF